MRILRRPLPAEWALLLGVTIVAAALRFYAIGLLPPGLYHDEAFNGLDALRVLGGERPIFFPANNGREPLFIYLVALSVAALGRSPGAIRIVAAVLGTLTVPAAHLMAKAMFDRRVGLATAAVTAITLWHVNLSRIGFRAVAMPLLVALTLWQLWLGLSGRGRRHFLAGGLLYGLTFYTYLAARFTVVALAAFGLYLALTGRIRPLRDGGLAFVLTALLVSAPLMTYAAVHRDAFLGRAGQVSIFNPAINKGDFWGTLLRHAGRTLLAFTHRGDFIPRHNVPHRPVFDPLMALFFLLGLALCARHARERAECAFVLIWLATMLVPTVLAEDAPHFLRAVGILPVAFAVPAVGLEAGWRFLRGRAPSLVAAAVLVAVLAASAGFTVRDYFLRHVRSEAAYYNFEAGAVELAVQANRFLGTGWDGRGLWAGSGSPPPGRKLYIAGRLWRDWATVRFLVPDSPGLTILGEEVPPGGGEEVMLILWPYEDNRRYLSLLPQGSLISVREGAMERGDLEKEARLLFVTFNASPPTGLPEGAEARFEKGITLLGHRLRLLSAKELEVQLLWRAEREAPPSTEGTIEQPSVPPASGGVDADYTVFVHLTRDGQLIAQSDSFPAHGYYPTSLWRPGDVVVDEHVLRLPEPYDPARHVLTVGLYRLETMRRLWVLDEEGRPQCDSVILQ